MIPPTKCPICNQPLINEFGRRIGCIDTLDKVCQRNPDHTFRCHGIDRVERMVFWLPDKTITFCVPRSLVISCRISKSKMSLPYFEPNLPFKELLDKVDLYLVFS